MSRGSLGLCGQKEANENFAASALLLFRPRTEDTLIAKLI